MRMDMKYRQMAGLLLGTLVSLALYAQAYAGLVDMQPEHMQSLAILKPQIKVALADPASARDWTTRHNHYYKRNWGVDIIGVRLVSSGMMLAFRYRVLDADKAKPLFDKAAKPYLVDEATGTRLAVPAMENVGELRQSAMLGTDRNYFMIFGNPGRLVKSGNRVTVVIGDFQIDNLIVD